MIKFSCLIPLYNDEKYIERCLKSVLNNGYKNIEVLIVNDGSTDKSEEICKRYLKNNSNIRLINKINSGVCDSRNMLINEFSGDYAVFIDSDDYVSKNFFADLSKLIENYDEPDLVTFDYNRVYNNNTISNQFRDDGSIIEYDSYSASREYLLGNKNFSMVLWRRCYKKEVLKKISFNNNMLPEDLATAFEIYSSSKTIVHICRSYYNYYIKDNGLSFQNSQNDYVNLLSITQKLYNQEKDYFTNDKYMLKVVNSIYINYLLTIYCNFYYSEKNEIRTEYLNIIDNYVKNTKLNTGIKTKVALLMYKTNKRLFCYILKRRIERNINNR